MKAPVAAVSVSAVVVLVGTVTQQGPWTLIQLTEAWSSRIGIPD
jgi:hypothetical protein